MPNLSHGTPSIGKLTGRGGSNTMVIMKADTTMLDEVQ